MRSERLEDSSYSDEAAGIEAVVGVGDFDALAAAGMDEVEGSVDGIHINDDAYMTDVAARAGTGEEHQVAPLHLAAAHGNVACVLVAGGTADFSSLYLTEHIAGES